MFRKILIILIAISFVPSAQTRDIVDFDNTIKGGKPGQIIAFRGKKIALEEIPYDEHCTEDYICLDSRFNARYEIIELLAGEYEGDVIDFGVYDHYGTPKFSTFDNVIVYINQFEGKLYHRKYAFERLYRTKNGKYATCGDPYARYEDDLIEQKGRQDLIPFDFRPAVKFKLSDYLLTKDDHAQMKQEHIREEFLETMRTFAPPAFEINGNVATCKMGMSPQDIVAIRMLYEYHEVEK